MLEIIWDTIIDGLKMFPFLWGAFFIIELLEHKFSKQSQRVIEKSGRLGPILGSILGCFPQCGFSAAAASLYAGRVITMGTLIAVFLYFTSITAAKACPVLASSFSNCFLSHGKALASKVTIRDPSATDPYREFVVYLSFPAQYVYDTIGCLPLLLRVAKT